MGFVLDLVPNHMGIEADAIRGGATCSKTGRARIYAHFFDIDWSPLKPELTDKVLLPILGDQYGARARARRTDARVP